MRSAHRQAGLSLIEMMIALLIGTFLILGLTQVFSASRTAYQLSEGMSRVQENGRFAMDFLQRDIRMAGHLGCVNDQAHLQTTGAFQNRFVAATPATNGISFPNAIRGYEATNSAPGGSVSVTSPTTGWTPARPAAITSLSPAPRAGSDIIELRYLAAEGAPITSITQAGATTVFTVPNGARWERAFNQGGVTAPTMFGIADCSSVDIFPAVAVNAAAGTVTAPGPITRYTVQPAGQTMLYRLESIVYYVATNGSGVSSLYRGRSNAGGTYTTEELVEGIESLQFIYGLDRTADITTNPPSGYVDVQQVASGIAATEAQWRRVGTVQVGMLVSSPNRAASTTPGVARRALGVEFTEPTPADGIYRSTYEATIALRNRLYGN